MTEADYLKVDKVMVKVIASIARKLYRRGKAGLTLDRIKCDINEFIGGGGYLDLFNYDEYEEFFDEDDDVIFSNIMERIDSFGFSPLHMVKEYDYEDYKIIKGNLK